MERWEPSKSETCPTANERALESPDQLCPTSAYGAPLIHSFTWPLGYKGVGRTDRAVCQGVVNPVYSALNWSKSPWKKVSLTMIGMVLALERICLTKRYLSYKGFITCRSFLVTWKGKRNEKHEFCSSRYSILQHMCLLSPLSRGAWREFHKDDNSTSMDQTCWSTWVCHHCISCPRCLMKQHPGYGMFCNVDV